MDWFKRRACGCRRSARCSPPPSWSHAVAVRRARGRRGPGRHRAAVAEEPDRHRVLSRAPPIAWSRSSPPEPHDRGDPPMSAAASPAPAAPIRVAAGTTAGAAVREAGLPEPRRRRRRSSSSATPRAGCATCPGCPTPTSRSSPVAADTEDGRSVIRHSARPRAGPGGAGPVPRGQAGHRPADHRRLLLRLRRAAARSRPRTWRRSRSGCRRSSRTVSCSPAGSTSPRTQAREELADEPYKLELVDDKSGRPRTSWRSAATS